MKNKKGIAADDLVPLLFFMVVGVFSIVGFISYGTVNAAETIKNVQQQTTEANTIKEFLEFYVSYPIDRTQKIYDLVNEAILKGDTTKLNTETNKIFDTVFPRQKNGIIILDAAGQTLFEYHQEISTQPIKELDTIQIPIHSVDGSESYVTVSLVAPKGKSLYMIP